MKNFVIAVIGAISLILGSVAVTHQTTDASTVEAGDSC